MRAVGPEGDVALAGRARGRHRTRDPTPRRPQLVVDAGQVLHQLERLAVAFNRGHAPGMETCEQLRRLGHNDFGADAPGHQLGHMGVQATAHLVAPAAQVDVTLGQEPQHRHVVLTSHLGHRRRTQGGDGHRAGVVRVVLVRAAAGEHPHPRGQGGGHVQYPLACRQQLLGQQIAQSVGGLDGPDAHIEGRGPLEQLLALAPSRSDPQGGELEFLVVECHRGVGTLVGVDPDHHHLRQVLLIVGRGKPWWALLIQDGEARPSFEPHHG